MSPIFHLVALVHGCNTHNGWWGHPPGFLHFCHQRKYFLPSYQFTLHAYRYCGSSYLTLYLGKSLPHNAHRYQGLAWLFSFFWLKHCTLPGIRNLMMCTTALRNSSTPSMAVHHLHVEVLLSMSFNLGGMRPIIHSIWLACSNDMQSKRLEASPPLLAFLCFSQVKIVKGGFHLNILQHHSQHWGFNHAMLRATGLCEGCPLANSNHITC